MAIRTWTHILNPEPIFSLILCKFHRLGDVIPTSQGITQIKISLTFLSVICSFSPYQLCSETQYDLAATLFNIADLESEEETTTVSLLSLYLEVTCVTSAHVPLIQTSLVEKADIYGFRKYIFFPSKNSEYFWTVIAQKTLCLPIVLEISERQNVFSSFYVIGWHLKQKAGLGFTEMK